MSEPKLPPRAIATFNYFVAGGYALTGSTFAEWKKLSPEIREEYKQGGELFWAYLGNVLKDPTRASLIALHMNTRGEDAATPKLVEGVPDGS